MPDTVEGNIWKALASQFEAIQAELDLPIAWPNTSFPKGGQRKAKKYLRVHHIPNSVNRSLIGSTEPHQRLGLLQVSVHWPHDESGLDLIEAAGRVAAFWPADLRLTSGEVEVRITQNPAVADMITDKTDVQVPVMIEWEAYA